MPVRVGLVARTVVAALLAVVACTVVIRLFVSAGQDALSAVLASGPDSPADVLVAGVAGAGAALTAWLGLGVVVSVLALLPGAVGRAAGRVSDRLAPVVVRRGVALLLGSTLAAAAAPAVAHADGGLPVPTLTSTSHTVAPPAPDPAFSASVRAPAVDAPPPQPTRSSPAPGPVPDPGFSPSTTTPTPAPAASPRAPDLGPLGQSQRPAVASTTVTVTRGDSLWRIAARHLGPGATNLQIAREWPRWYAANRTVIGPDPDLILVGQVLTVPAPEGARS